PYILLVSVRRTRISRRCCLAYVGENPLDTTCPLLYACPGAVVIQFSSRGATCANRFVLALQEFHLAAKRSHSSVNYAGNLLVNGGHAWHSAYAMFGAIRLRTALSTSSCTTIP